MDGFTVKGCHHEFPAVRNGRIEVVTQRYAGPVASFVVGIEDGKYFKEFHEAEYFDDELDDLKYISREEFVGLVEEEIQFCMKYNRTRQAEELRKYVTT